MKSILIKLILFLIILHFTGISLTQTTIQLKPGPSEGKDCRIWSLSPGSNYGDYEMIKANAWTWDGVFGMERSFLGFDLDTIPEDIIIDEAKLSLYYHYLPGNPEQTHSGSNFLLIQRIVNFWEEFGVTWYNQPGVTDQNQIIVDPSVHPQQDYTDIDVKEMVIDMIDNPSSSFGFSVRIQTEETYRRVALSSSDHSDPSKHPELTITYCFIPEASFEFEIIGNLVYFTNTSENADTYLWIFGDGNFSTLENPVHFYTEQADYEVCLIASNYCTSDTTCEIVRFEITSLEYHEDTPNIHISPNPVDNFAGISINNLPNTSCKIYIFDPCGKAVIKENYFMNSNSEFLLIDMSDLDPGLYFLNLASPQYKLNKKIIVK